MKKFIIFFLVALLTMVSCATQRAAKQANVSVDQVAVMSITIDEVIDDYNAIGITNDRYHRTVKLKDETTKFYEGAIYHGSFVFIGTYAYQDEIRKKLRVLPVYTPTKAYLKTRRR